MPERGRQMLDVLMKRRNEWVTACSYCGKLIVNVRLAPKDWIQKASKDNVVLSIRGRIFRMKRVTADHYLERCYGGRSDLNNILPACDNCNNGRSIGREWPRPRVCVDCNGTRTGSARRRCKRCLKERELLAFNPS